MSSFSRAVTVDWVYEKAGKLSGIDRHAREQWLRASQSILLNIAEGNGKTAEADRRRHFEIGRGYPVHEEPAVYKIDPDPDSDEPEFKPRPSVSNNACQRG